MDSPTQISGNKRLRYSDNNSNPNNGNAHTNYRPQHENIVPTPSPTPGGLSFNPADYPKRRVLVACEVCRVRKTRCDAVRPSCSFCANLGVECVYRKAVNPSAKRAVNERKPELELPTTAPELKALIERARVALQNLTQAPDVSSPTFSYTEDDADSPSVPVSQALAVRRLSGASSRTHKSWDTFSPRYVEGSRQYPCFVGANLHGFARMLDRPIAPQLAPLCYDDGESFLEREVGYHSTLWGESSSQDPLGLDLSFRTCFKNQQSFARNILAWFPVFDQQVCIDLVKTATENGLDPSEASTCLTLFILALGALTRAEDTLSLESTAETPGLDYFQAGSRCLNNMTTELGTITQAQCLILKALYLLLCLRHLAAFDTIHSSSIIIVRLLALQSRLESDQTFRESCHRAYWICYMIEHELRGCVHVGTQVLESFQEHMPLDLDLLDHAEPAMFWFLSEIALRRIFINSLCSVGQGGRTIYAPRVSEELNTQLQQWYGHLHPSVKFPLGTEPLLDMQKAFLRSQFYAAIIQVHWPSVVQILTNPPKNRNDPETIAMFKSAEQAIQYTVLHLNTMEGLLQDRFLMSFTTHISAFAFSMLLLCVFDAEEFRPLHAMNTTINVIQRVRQLMEPWAKLDQTVAANMRRIDDLMRLKGIQLSDT